MASTVPRARSTKAVSALKTQANSVHKTSSITSYKASINKTIYPEQHPIGDLKLSVSPNRVLALVPGAASEAASGSASEVSSTTAFRVLGLNHFNITASARLIEQVKQFYLDIIGLKTGTRAHLDHEGYWLYAGALPILHLSARPGIETVVSTRPGFFNHISLSCVGLKGAIARLTAAHIPYRQIELLDIQQTQLFVTDPAGIGVELTFFNERL
ncbi:MAG: hypothetical protein AAGN15_08855 [Cyanobacteria bacterium J06581_3]